MNIKINIAHLRQCLEKGDFAAAAASVAAEMQNVPQEQRQQVAAELIAGIKQPLADLDPILLERFFGYFLMAINLPEQGKMAFLRADRWQKAMDRAQRELALDFSDQAALYHFLGANDFREYAQAKNPTRFASTSLLLDDRTVAWHFHGLQMEKCLPLLCHFPGSSWLTLGDGRMAFEARFLASHGARVMPTNLDPTLLEECKKAGYIEDYRIENMEQLSFADKSFDFVCCKDSLHHCLHPYKALYEMLRVAKKGIFLVEPFDLGFCASPIYGTRTSPWHHFEDEAGNYAYSFSERELEKLCVSHGWRFLATRGICNVAEGEVDDASANPQDLERLRTLTQEREQEAAVGKGCWTNMASILLREAPREKLRQDIELSGYTAVVLPKNPHTLRAVLQSLDILYNGRD